jgi:hypothetical protein
MAGGRELENPSQIQGGKIEPLGLSDCPQFGLVNVPADAVERRCCSRLAILLLMSQLNGLHQEDIVVRASWPSDLSVLPGSDLNLNERIKRISLRNPESRRTDVVAMADGDQIGILREAQRDALGQ